VLEVGSTRPP